MSVCCPACRGQKSNVVLACTMDGTGCRNRLLTCDLCDGKGAISAERFAWYQRGQVHRQLRLDRGFTLREEAGRRGICAASLSRMERGVDDPEQLFMPEGGKEKQ